MSSGILKHALLFLALLHRSCHAHSGHLEAQRLRGRRFLSRVDMAADELSVEEQEQPAEKTFTSTLTPVWSTSSVGTTTATNPVVVITTSPLPTAPESTTTIGSAPEEQLTKRQLEAMLSGTTLPPTVGQAARGAAASSWISRMVWQLVFGVLYYALIVKHYPKLGGHTTPNIEVITLQEKNQVAAACEASWPILFHSFCCSGSRAAHTFHTVGIMNYWSAWILMTACPCCTLFLANSFTDLNSRLGGDRDSPLMGLLCSCLCSCCVIAQDAEALDIIGGMKTGFFTVSYAGLNSERSEF